MEAFCRGCLEMFNEPTDLTPYNEKNRRLFVYSTGIQVKRNDTFTFQLCKECYLNMKQSCRFKKQCRSSDKKFKNYITMKEQGDTLDFHDYIKNSEESLTLRLPLASASSTPTHQKQKDDDNESTCTSIRNFMTDIMQGTEMPDSEARIIRELIEEEADILDDSLDSHWLHDDMSIDTDFRMDFSFTPFSTPHSVNYDHCYTPKRIDDDKPKHKYLSPTKHDTSHSFDMPLLDIEEFDTDPVTLENGGKTYYYAENNDYNNVADNITDIADNLKEIQDNLMNENEENHTLVPINNGIECTDVFDDNYGINHEMEVVTDNDYGYLDNDDEIGINNGVDVDINDENEVIHSDMIDINEQSSDFIAPTANENDLLEAEANQGKNDNPNSSPLNNELEYYINKVEIKKKERNKDEKCSIDRNLELALQSADDKEFSLDQLLTSPRVSATSGGLHQEECDTPAPSASRSALTQRRRALASRSKARRSRSNARRARAVEFIMSIRSGASTPTIKNILFGDTLEDTTQHFDINIEKIQPDENDTNIIEEFFNSDVNSTKLNDDKIEFNNIQGEDEKENYDAKQIQNEEILHLINEDSIDIDKLIETGQNTELQLDKIEINEDLFKRPFSPPDNKYDLEQCLCKICDLKFKSSRALKVHFTKFHKIVINKIHQPKRCVGNRLCMFCGKVYQGIANLSKHVSLKHKNEKELEKRKEEDNTTRLCPECPLVFPNKDSLNRHILRSHKKGTSDVEKKFVCSLCGKAFALKKNYELHMRRHEKRYLFTCHICNRGCYSNYELNEHLRTHTKDKPYECSYCGKFFKRRNILKIHTLNYHSGTPKFRCDICDAGFVKKYMVRRHLTHGKCASRRMIREYTTNQDKTDS